MSEYEDHDPPREMTPLLQIIVGALIGAIFVAAVCVCIFTIFTAT